MLIFALGSLSPFMNARLWFCRWRSEYLVNLFFPLLLCQYILIVLMTPSPSLPQSNLLGTSLSSVMMLCVVSYIPSPVLFDIHFLYHTAILYM